MVNLVLFKLPHPTEICDIIKTSPKDLSQLKNEDIINLERCLLDPTIAQAEINFCDNYLSTSQGMLSRLIVEVRKEAFFFLFEKASALWNGTENYVSGLKIHFGLVGNKIFPLFQPVYLKKLGAATSGDINYDVQYEDYYVYDAQNKMFVNAVQSDKEKISNYQDAVNGIQIKHFGEIVFDKFRSGEDSEGVIFPFQMILQLLDDNPTSASIFIYNAIRTEGGDIKHCVLLAPSAMPFLRNSVKDHFQNTYANRSHLCPPCTVKLDIYKLGPTTCP